MNYPFAPPQIMLLTPNGRFEISKKICLSMSNYHPELWQPAWGLRTMIEALRSFFPSPPEGALGRSLLRAGWGRNSGASLSSRGKIIS